MDLYINSNEEVEFESGDFKLVSNPVNQVVRHILKANKGEYKQTPQLGVGLNSFLLESGQTGLKNELLVQFRLDGVSYKKIILQEGSLTIQTR